MKQLKYFFLLVLFTVNCNITYSQEYGLFKKIEQKKLTDERVEYVDNVLQVSRTHNKVDFSKFQMPSKVTVLTYNNHILQTKNKGVVSLKVPFGSREETFELIEVSDDFFDYEVVLGDGQRFPANRNNKHYRGVIKGKEKSYVAISFFEDNVMGIISTGKSTYNIAKERKSRSILLYEEANLKEKAEFECGSVDEDYEYDSRVLSGTFSPEISNSSKCVKIYYETAYDVYLSFNRDRWDTEDFVTGIFNQVGTLYQNEGIKIAIHSIRIRIADDPYTNSTRLGILNQFKAEIDNMDADLGQLLLMRNIGGMAATTNSAFCRTTNSRLCIAGMSDKNVNDLPNYTFNVYVSAHELGHLFGSRHTHACVWDAFGEKNRALDPCQPINGCVDPPMPDAGTIMSYCHTVSGVGIDFYLGFGEQPGNVIRFSVGDADCLGSCTGCIDEVSVFHDVTGGQVDNRSANNILSASNAVRWGADADYSAGDLVLLIDGFEVNKGADFIARIDDCGNAQVSNPNNAINTQLPNDGTEISDDINDSGDLKVKLHPNPFNSITNISFSVKETSAITIMVFGIDGQVIDILTDNKVMESGRHQVQFEGIDLPPGVYFVNVQNGNQNSIEKLVLVK